MSGKNLKIIKYDMYDMRKFKPDEIKMFIDIGANIGETSLMARTLYPKAKIIAFEPAKKTFDKLLKNVQYWGVECYNVALGDGNLMCLSKGRRSGLNKFYSIKGKDKWSDNEHLSCSESLSSLFKNYIGDIGGAYIIKIDCEGGERFLFNDDQCIDIIRKSTQTMMELHFGLGGTAIEWKKWLNKFKNTHNLKQGRWIGREASHRKYIYEMTKELTVLKGHPQIELINKRWKN